MAAFSQPCMGHKARRSRKGFTLIELMIVVAIIGVLVGVLLAVLLGARSKAKVGEARNFLDTAMPTAITKWQEAIKGGRADIFPASGTSGDADLYEGNRLLFDELVTKPQKAGKEAYIAADSYTTRENKGKKEFVDPWENPYRYRNWAQAAKGAKGYKKYNEGTYDLVSAGPDGNFDTEDDVINGKK